MEETIVAWVEEFINKLKLDIFMMEEEFVWGFIIKEKDRLAVRGYPVWVAESRRFILNSSWF